VVFALSSASALLAACSTGVAIPADLPANVAPSSQALGAGQAGTVLSGDPAPDFSYIGADGRAVKLSDLRGKVVVLNFWATWCGPCRQEMPDLQKIADRHAGEVLVLGVNKLEEPAAIGPFARELGVRFTLVANPAGDIAEAYGVRNLPTSFFVRPDGTIGEWRLGALDEAEIERAIEQSR
jgi:peroxiredoxin